MSNRTLLEVNHDYAHEIERDSSEFMTALLNHLRSASSRLRELSPGVQFLGVRHHSESYSIKWGSYSGGYRSDEMNRRIWLEQKTCAGLSDAALEQDIVAKVRSALAPFAFRTSQRIGDEDKPDDYKIQAVISMGEIRAIRAALSLLSNKEAE